MDDIFMYVPEGTMNNPIMWVSKILNLLFMATIAISLISIIMAGIKFATAQGDIKAADSAKKTLEYSILAFIGSIGSVALLNVVINSLNIQNSGLNFFGL